LVRIVVGFVDRCKGNYGVPPTDVDPTTGIPLFRESGAIHATALLVADYSYDSSHWNSVMNLSQWLKEQNVPALYGIDTRAITKKIRDKGSMLAKITFNNDAAQSNGLFDPNKENLVAQVSIKEPKIYCSSTEKAIKTVIAIDCGMKFNQIRCLVKRGVRVKVVPWNYDLSKESDYDGVFISNGPGDPIFCQETIKQIRQLIQVRSDIYHRLQH
jgi:carbamoyl-phosphate synthase small subunit